ncbi:hypothetical protein Tco_0768224 [Tanacetum coccineum]
MSQLLKKIVIQNKLREIRICKNLALIAKYFKKIYKPTNNNFRTSSNSRNQNVDTSLRYKNDNQIWTLLGTIRCLDIMCHSEQPEFISNTCVAEKVDSNVTPELLDMCDNDIQTDQNAEECNNERDALANLIANLKLDVEENKKIQKQLKKANTSLAHELKECKSILAETSKISRESNTIRDSCLIALQNKQTEIETYKTLNDRTVDYDKLEHKLNETLGLLAQKKINIKEGLKLKAYEISIVKEKHDEELVDQAWEKHSHDQFRAPTAHDMEVLIKTCLMPLALKTQNDSFRFVSKLEQKMHADLKYVESLEKEIDELESDKADAHIELQCMYQHKVKECECLVEKLFKQNETVSKEVYNELLRSFAKLENHSISLELALQQCQEQMKNDIVCKEKESTVFLKEHEQYFEIQDLKAQLQDKNIAIIAKHRSASQAGVSNNLTKLVTSHSWPQVRKSSFAKPYNVNAPVPSRNSPKHVSFQSPRESVGSNDMVHNYYLEEAKNKAQLLKDKALNTKPSVQPSVRLPNTTNGNKPKPRNFNQQPRNWPPSMSSRISNRTVNIAEPPRNQNPFLKSKDLACLTCKK